MNEELQNFLIHFRALVQSLEPAIGRSHVKDMIDASNQLLNALQQGDDSASKNDIAELRSDLADLRSEVERVERRIDDL